MNKQLYITPQTERSTATICAPLLGASAPDEGIHDGGPGSDDDDPSAKPREGIEQMPDDSWGTLW